MKLVFKVLFIMFFLIGFLNFGFISAENKYALDVLSPEQVKSIIANITPEQKALLYQKSLNYKLSEKERSDIIASLEIDPNSIFAKRYLGQANKVDWSEEVEKIAGIKHLRGSQGVEFGKQDEALNSKTKRHTDSSQKNLSDPNKEYIKSYIESLKKPIKLNKCTEDITNKIKIADSNNSRPSFDILFLQDSLAQVSSISQTLNDLFGEITKVKLYYEDRDIDTHHLARAYKVDCLPTRIRSTTSFLFIDKGKNALKNYDKDYHGQGVLNEVFN